MVEWLGLQHHSHLRDLSSQLASTVTELVTGLQGMQQSVGYLFTRHALYSQHKTYEALLDTKLLINPSENNSHRLADFAGSVENDGYALAGDKRLHVISCLLLDHGNQVRKMLVSSLSCEAFTRALQKWAKMAKMVNLADANTSPQESLQHFNTTHQDSVRKGSAFSSSQFQKF